MAKQAWKIILSCEHGGNKIPSPWRKHFCTEDRADIDTHRGWDIGALAIARLLQKQFDCELYFSTTTRLLVDLNRSPQHPHCFGISYRELSPEDKLAILTEHYFPYREAVSAALEKLHKKKQKILHVSVHSFTPVLRGEVRKADVALLYDPKRKQEKLWADRWLEQMRHTEPQFRYRRNYPYLGTADAFTTALRRQFPENAYAGLEVEVNQKHIDSLVGQRAIAKLLIDSLAPCLE